MVGTCIEGTRWTIDAPDVDAHSHVDSKDDWRGWICVAKPQRGHIGSGRFAELIAHEYAHLLAAGLEPPCHSHGAPWSRIFTELGYGKEARAFVRRHGTR